METILKAEWDRFREDEGLSIYPEEIPSPYKEIAIGAMWRVKNLNIPAVSGRYSWLQKDDLQFAIALQQENRLDAVKWLCEKAKGYSLTPLKDAKDILDAYH